MRIHDNGRVNLKTYKTTGLDLSNIKLIAKKLNGTVTIDTEAGYEVLLKIHSF